VTTFVVQFSGGVSSWGAARIVLESVMVSGDSLELLFADTLMEDEDTYAFLEAGAADLGVEVTRVADGRTIWEVFKDKGFLGNSRVDPCSRILKRDLLLRYMNDTFDLLDTVIVFGLDWMEMNRVDSVRERMRPWATLFPLADPIDGVPAYSKHDLLDWAARRGLPKQRLYEWGLPHANCGGMCVKAGQGAAARLLEVFPERYAEWEANEEDVRQHLGQDVTIMKMKPAGVDVPVTLRTFREGIESGNITIPEFVDWGGCNCV